MAQLMKDRTDNDIKNKWNSMNRSARRALDTLTKQGNPNDVEILHNSTKQMFDGSSWEENDVASNGTTAAAAAMIFRPRTYPSESGFTKTVTDGASANNSPVVQKNYWETTLEF
jgi:hypothetical protein